MVVRRDAIPAVGTLARQRIGVAGLADAMASLRHWPARRWMIAAGAAALFAVAAGVPTDVIPNPLAHREVPATWWSYPTLAATALLGGMLTATYARSRADRDVTGRSTGGGLLSLLAIGCPACNKLVVLLVGTSGALSLWGRWHRAGRRVPAMGQASPVGLPGTGDGRPHRFFCLSRCQRRQHRDQGRLVDQPRRGRGHHRPGVGACPCRRARSCAKIDSPVRRAASRAAVAVAT